MTTTRPTVTQNEKRIELLERAIQELTSISKKHAQILTGNGEPGMDEDVRIIKKDLAETNKRVGVIESDLKNLTKMMSNFTGNNPAVVYDDKHHPSRRAEDNPDIIPERKWFIDKVLPGLVQSLIVAIATAFFVLILLNATNFLK